MISGENLNRIASGTLAEERIFKKAGLVERDKFFY